MESFNPAWVYTPIQVLNVLDIILQFRTTIHDTNTGDEIFSLKEIAWRYITSFYFFFDFMAAVPFIVMVGVNGESKYEVFMLLKLFSLLKVKLNFSHSEIVKVLYKLLVIFISLLIYIHLSTCLLYYSAKLERKWTPPVVLDSSDPEEFYNKSTFTKYVFTLYGAVLVLTGNEISPVGEF